jgi:biopolymer transport protein TolQ
MTQQHLSIITLISDASPVVKIIMGILIAASILSWTIISQKIVLIFQAQKSSKKFEQYFWQSTDISLISQELLDKKEIRTPLENIFLAGTTAFFKARTQPKVIHQESISSITSVQGHYDSNNHENNSMTPHLGHSHIPLLNAQRAMRATIQREIEGLETGLSWLASIGSISPYIGLFGTVWGIIHAFSGLADVQNVTLANVAPGIAEALVATAIGLFTSIPAVLAYNRFIFNIDSLAIKFENFQDEYANVLELQ